MGFQLPTSRGFGRRISSHHQQYNLPLDDSYRNVYLGMVPLTINPIYTLYSGYLLSISLLKGFFGGLKQLPPKGTSIFSMILRVVFPKKPLADQGPGLELSHCRSRHYCTGTGMKQTKRLIDSPEVTGEALKKSQKWVWKRFHDFKNLVFLLFLFVCFSFFMCFFSGKTKNRKSCCWTGDA